MDTKFQLKLSVLKGIEPSDTWQSLCKSPASFLQEIADRLGAEFSAVIGDVVLSSSPPDISLRDKVWIKTSPPYAIGKMIGGSYQMDYGMSGFNPNIPFQAKKFDPMPEGVRQLSSSEVKEFGLYDANDEKATKKMNWYIFEPLDIRI